MKNWETKIVPEPHFSVNEGNEKKRVHGKFDVMRRKEKRKASEGEK